MKKYLIAMLALVLVLCTGCGRQEAVQTEAPETTAAPTTEETVMETTAEPTTEETEPVPQLSMGSAVADQVPAILLTLNREDLVDVVGEYDQDHYVIKTELGYGLVKKALLRAEGADAYETWKGYAHYNANVYDNYYLEHDPLKVLPQNAAVEVLDDIGYCYVVRVEDVEGFMKKSDVSKWPASSGGSSSGGKTGADGGDITLQFQAEISLLSAIEQTGEVSGQAAVLADGTEVILGYFDRGEEVPMVAEPGFAEDWDGYVTVYLNGIYAHVPQILVQESGAQAYEQWTGFSRWNGVIYDNYHLAGEPIQKLYTNAEVQVLAELNNCYLVEMNGMSGYIAKDLVSKTRIPTDGGSSSSGSGGDEWTPPAL